MAQPRAVVRGVVEGSADQLAFRIGQSLERTLVARAIQLATRDAGKCDEVLVTAEHIRRALDGAVINEACSQIGIVLDGKTEPQCSNSRTG
jgi:hypothetical protein